jgi:hypothetical protein
MFWNAIRLLAVAVCAGAVSAQNGLQQLTEVPAAPALKPNVERMLRELMKKNGMKNEATVCSIPLLEVRVSNNVDPMPNFKPRAEPDTIDNMPSLKVPAPPCKGEKR